MRRLCDCVRYYFSKIADNTQSFLKVGITALSFIFIIFTFFYIVFYLFIEFDFIRVVAGAVSLYTFIHLNKSM